MISIISPVYNVEKYLEACVNSILKSTFADFELILVDDGSTDRSGAICDDYQEKDQRVKVIHQANAGVSAARNAGLKASKAEYITFVDSDDVVHPSMLETLMEAISSGDYDMSMVLHQKIGVEDREHFLTSQMDSLGKNEPKPQTQDDYMTAVFHDFYGYFSGPCHKLYKRELIFDHDGLFIEFKKIPAEDIEWLIRMALRLDKYVLVPLYLYFYVSRADSLTNDQAEQGMNPIILGRLKTHHRCLGLIPKEKVNYRSMCLVDLYNKMKFFTYNAHGTSYQDETRALCKVVYQDTVHEFLHMPVGALVKLKNLLFYHCPWVYRLIVHLSELIAKCRLR